MTDFANTSDARRQRELKATALARAVYADLTPERRRELSKLAGVRPASALTWARAAELLAARFRWDARHPEQRELSL